LAGGVGSATRPAGGTESGGLVRLTIDDGETLILDFSKKLQLMGSKTGWQRPGFESEIS
jgi:hypothetical protein